HGPPRPGQAVERVHGVLLALAGTGGCESSYPCVADPDDPGSHRRLWTPWAPPPPPTPVQRRLVVCGDTAGRRRHRAPELTTAGQRVGGRERRDRFFPPGADGRNRRGAGRVRDCGALRGNRAAREGARVQRRPSLALLSSPAPRVRPGGICGPAEPGDRGPQP